MVVLAGTVEASTGEEHGTLGAGGALLVSALVPHGIRSIGPDRVRCIGFFGAPGVESVFDDVMMPMGTNVISTMVSAGTRSCRS